MLKKFYSYYKATYPGEIFEKGKRKLLIKSGYFKPLKIDKNISIKISEIFIFSKNISREYKLNYEVFSFFSEKKDLMEEINWGILEKDNNTPWFKIKIQEYSDIKYLWEINRLQFLLPLLLSGRKERALFLLKDWEKNNKFDYGPNWYSNLEIAIRGINILNFLLALNDKKILEKYKYLIYQHGLHIYEDIQYTEKCIPNNHLVGEAAALYCISKFLNHKDSLKWEKKAKKILREMISHIKSDGTYIEGSLSYHRFFLQMYIMVYIFSRKTQDNFLEESILETIEKSYIFFKAIEKPTKEFPNLGDNDEGHFYKVFYKSELRDFVKSIHKFLYITQESNYLDELEILCEIYQVENEKKKLEKEKEKAFFFEEGKFLAIKENKNYLLFHNQTQLYHAHSDGLSVELMLEGMNIFSDAGTYSYNLDKKKRKYYRSTRAHNTIVLDDEDQSLQIGSFRWINPAQNSLLIKIENPYFIESIGTISTKSKKNHFRKIILKKTFENITIEDTVNNVTQLELNWNFHKGIDLEKIDDQKYKILGTRYILEIEMDFKGKIFLEKKWESFCYGEEHLRLSIIVKNLETKNEYNIKTIVRKNK